MVVEPVLRVAQPVCEADLLPDHLMSAHTAPDESRVSWPLSQGAFFRMQENVEGEEEVMEEEHEEHEQEQEEQEQEQKQEEQEEEREEQEDSGGGGGGAAVSMRRLWGRLTSAA